MTTLPRKTEPFTLFSRQRYDSTLAIVPGKAQGVSDTRNLREWGAPKNIGRKLLERCEHEHLDGAM